MKDDEERERGLNTCMYGDKGGNGRCSSRIRNEEMKGKAEEGRREE